MVVGIAGKTLIIRNSVNIGKDWTFEEFGGCRNLQKNVNNPEIRPEVQKNENTKLEFEAQKRASRICS